MFKKNFQKKKNFFKELFLKNGRNIGNFSNDLWLGMTVKQVNKINER